MIGVLVGAGIAWWIFLLLQPYLAFPLFGFVVLVIGYLGYRLGAPPSREDALTMFASRAGMDPRPQTISNLPRIVDTSVAIDGRIVDVVRAGFVHGLMLVPSPAAGRAPGPRGRRRRPACASKGRTRPRGLETLKRREPGVDVEVLDEGAGGPRGRRQAGADLPGPGGGPAHPGHQPGQGRRAGRRPRHEPARARPVAATAGRELATK